MPADAHTRFLLNGQPFSAPTVEKGHARIDREWRPGDTLEVAFPVAPTRVHAHARVADLAGQVALARGPLLYLFEGIDNGGKVEGVAVPADAELRDFARPDRIDGPPAIEVIAGDKRLLAFRSMPGQTENRPTSRLGHRKLWRSDARVRPPVQ
ncbi:MAG: glycoside hydrolase family 127 protein [Pirellulales bacterium]